MTSKMRFSAGFLLAWAFIMALSLFGVTERAIAQNPITFSDARIENHFPDRLVFRISAASAEGQITSVRLFYKLRNDVSESQVVVDLTPAKKVDLAYTWETGDITIPPSTPIFYHWEVSDSAGNRSSSEEALFYYDDVRYDWQVLENEAMAVWWHDRPHSFGEQVYNIAGQVLEDQRRLFGTELTFPIRIIIYNTDEEFAGWHSYVSEFVGGQAFPPLGITTQIVSDSGSQDEWLNDVIPHEISHLYFYQVTYHPLIITPSWLNEGLAQYNELNDNSYMITIAGKAIQEGKLIPLTALTGSFGYNDQKVRLAYAESISAVEYLVETYGESGLAALLAAYKSGLADQEAFQHALGVTLTDFEADWLVWMGAPEGMYGTPTPTVSLWLSSTPTMPGVDSYQATGTPEPGAIPSQTPEETTTPTSAPPEELPGTAVAQGSPPEGYSPDANSESGADTKRLFCIGGLLPGLLLLVVIRGAIKSRAARRIP